MTSMELVEQQQFNELSDTASHSPIVPPTTPPKSPNLALQHHNKMLSTKAPKTEAMMQTAIKALSTKSRKGFSLASIRKYMMDHFLHTRSELQHRLRFMRQFFKTALERGDVISSKGAKGLTGRFRVPPTSSLHKNAKQNIQRLKNKSNKTNKKNNVKKATNKKTKSKRNATKLKNMKFKPSLSAGHSII